MMIMGWLHKEKKKKITKSLLFNMSWTFDYGFNTTSGFWHASWCFL